MTTPTETPAAAEAGSFEELMGRLGKTTIDDAFKDQDMLNALRMIIMSDKDIEQMVMRYNLPSRQFAVAVASLWRKYEAKEYEIGKRQILILLGLMASVGNQRINDLVHAITAEKKQSGDMGERFKNWIDGLGK